MTGMEIADPVHKSPFQGASFPNNCILIPLRYAHLPFSVKSKTKYLQFSPEELEAEISKLFES